MEVSYTGRSSLFLLFYTDSIIIVRHIERRHPLETKEAKIIVVPGDKTEKGTQFGAVSQKRL